LSLLVFSSLFLSALSFGFTACVFGCMSIVTPVVFRAVSDGKSALFAITPMIAGRVLGYATLSLIAFAGTLFAKEVLQNKELTRQMIGAVVIFVALIQLYKIFFKIKNDCKTVSLPSGIGIFAIGFLLAFTPCSAVLNLMALSLSAEGLVDALAYGVVFGFGAVIGMVVLYGFLLGRVAKTTLEELQKYKIYIEYLSIALLFLAGVFIALGVTKI